MIEKEIWLDVVGYEDIYEVSNLGRVRTKCGKKTSSSRHGERVWKQRYLKDKTPNGRDFRVSLWKDKKPKDFLVHRLVGIAFLNEIKGKDFINHKDGNPKNNKVENLEWCDYKENNNHAFDNGLIKTCKKITLVNEITKEKIEFRSMSKASEFLGKNAGYISSLLKKSIKKTNGYEIQND